jgi:SAM domain (Sterile alpha motif)
MDPRAFGEASVDIATWLHGLGLQRYEQVFRENAIDDAVLPELTADDLKELGVSLVGHRRKLLAAIAALRAESEPEPRAEARDVVDTSIAERRHLTVMFIMIPRICARSSAPITAVSPIRSPGSPALSPSIWATAF